MKKRWGWREGRTERSCIIDVDVTHSGLSYFALVDLCKANMYE